MSWRPKDWKNPYPPPKFHPVGLIYRDVFEAGADAMLEALFKLAEESPTKTFTIDSQFYQAFKKQ